MILGGSAFSYAQKNQPGNESPGRYASFKMMGVVPGPKEGTVLVKMYDEPEGVACYVLSPERLQYKLESLTGNTVYPNNAVGSLSCVNVRTR